MSFIDYKPTDETLWRAIILFGRNVASYKFALGKSLLNLASKEKTFITLDELAVPFSQYLCEHLKIADKQGTFQNSQFLDACRKFNNGEIVTDELIKATVKSGFNNVIDAFHIVGPKEVPTRFFVDERKQRNGVLITDELLALKDKIQFSNLPFEVEARWRLVETAWELNISRNLLSVKYDSDMNLFFAENKEYRRIDITSSRDALNGYQKGKCFYCFRDIVIDSSDPDFMTEVDHFFPHVLLSQCTELNLNGIWNLILTCQECNRKKLAQIPSPHLLERLYERNEFFIQSHHPLRETIIMQTGATSVEREDFLKQADSTAIGYSVHRWKPRVEFKPIFQTSMTTVEYYNKNAKQFFEETLNLEMKHFYEPFLALLPKGGKILDAGCGSGRDSLYFKNNGHNVTAFDNCKELVTLASEVIEQQVLHIEFSELNFKDEFDGIWACASLLHIPKAQIDDILNKLSNALKTQGVLYASFKYGEGETVERERLFNNYNEDSFKYLLGNHHDFKIIDIWKTEDVRQDRVGKFWLNILLQKVSHNRSI